MNQEKIKTTILVYFQVLAFGLILVFSPCSVRNSIQDSFGFEKTKVSNKFKSTNHFEQLCSNFRIESSAGSPARINNLTPEYPFFKAVLKFNTVASSKINQDVSLSQYKAPYTLKDKTPLYLLHQQFKVYMKKA